jgi:hypothetical protein
MDRGFELIVVGDKKTPDGYRSLDLHFLNIEDQRELFGDFADMLPYNHYARKNLGYLYAIRNGYDRIIETDDDNLPMEGWPCLPESKRGAQIEGPEFPNVYRYFTDKHIWPRGYPLDRISNPALAIKENISADNIHVWQGLVDGDPDVDAIFRLTRKTSDEHFQFERKNAVIVKKGCVVPFNTQNTTWLKQSSFAFLYLPCTVSFRATDILKSYVAQFCIWAQGGAIGFTQATALQDRNAHDLMRDFEDEQYLYTNFYRIIETLRKVPYDGQASDLKKAYGALAENGLVEPTEVELVEQWLNLIETV